MPKTEAINWRLQCKTIQRVMKAKFWTTKCWVIGLINATSRVVIVESWVLSSEFWVLSAEWWVMSAVCWVLVTTSKICQRLFPTTSGMQKFKPQVDDWFLSVLHILGQEIYSLISKNYIIWRLHCMTILGVIQVKFWVLNVASWGLSAECYKLLQLLEITKWYDKS